MYILFVISSQLPTSVPNYPSVYRKIKPSAKYADGSYTIISYESSGLMHFWNTASSPVLSPLSKDIMLPVSISSWSVWVKSKI